jgi:hypothetical protein
MERDEQAAVQAERPQDASELDPAPARDSGRRCDLVRAPARCHGSIPIFLVLVALFAPAVLAVPAMSRSTPPLIASRVRIASRPSAAADDLPTCRSA